MVIILMGAAGAGKTTIGRALAAELGWTFVDGDDHHPSRNIEKMHASVPLGDAERAPWLSALRAVALRALDRREHTVMACSALRRQHRDILRGGLDRMRFVYLQAGEAELLRRLGSRADHFAGPGLLQSQLASLEAPSADEAFTVDATWSPERILAAIRAEFGV